MSKDLIEYLQQHLAYEIEMLNGTYVRIPRVKGNDNDAILKNALIESFCLHARALFEFFRKESARHEYTEAHYQFFNRESSFSQKLNTQIAHLVFEGRTTEEEEKIGARDRFDMVAALRDEWLHFKAHLTTLYASTPLPDVAPFIKVATYNTTSSAPSSSTTFVSNSASKINSP